ncbi:MAG: hypothetical protein ACRDQB_04685, partial [Thermocrispum sp.]
MSASRGTSRRGSRRRKPEVGRTGARFPPAPAGELAAPDGELAAPDGELAAPDGGELTTQHPAPLAAEAQPEPTEPEPTEPEAPAAETPPERVSTAAEGFAELESEAPAAEEPPDVQPEPDGFADAQAA